MLDREKVGRVISEQRKMKGMTQKQLADMLNVSFQAVSRWEQGVSLPSVDMIYEIARILETTVDYLLNGPLEERKVISYADGGLDVKKLHMVKDRLNKLATRDDRLFDRKYSDPVFFRPDMVKTEEPVCVFANHVPGSKERFAVENGYDREICVDLVSNAANNLIRFGVKPQVLQAITVCGNNDSGQLLVMGEAFKEACERNGILFAGMEVAAQAINYREGDYKTGAVVTGFADRKNIITGEKIAEGDILIGLYSEGISSVSYPFVKVILDRRPDIIDEKVDGKHLFMDELMKPNACYVNVVVELIQQGLLHGVFGITKSLFTRRCYDTMPKGLGAGILVSQIPSPALFRYLYELDMMDRECFLKDFSPGIGMVVAVPAERYGSAVDVIKKHHKCYCLGKIQKDTDHPDEKVWMEGAMKW